VQLISIYKFSKQKNKIKIVRAIDVLPSFGLEQMSFFVLSALIEQNITQYCYIRKPITMYSNDPSLKKHSTVTS